MSINSSKSDQVREVDEAVLLFFAGVTFGDAGAGVILMSP
eukprot:COSAG01_NODE_15633_length_1317_cov_1.340722_2_plen_40_part_00